MDTKYVDQQHWGILLSRGRNDAGLSEHVKDIPTGLEFSHLAFGDFEYQHVFNVKQIQFRHCRFDEHFSIEHGPSWDGPVVNIDFISCSFKTLSVNGNNSGLVLHFLDFLAFNSLEIYGPIRNTTIKNQITHEKKLINRIEIIDKDNSVASEISIKNCDLGSVSLTRCSNLKLDITSSTSGTLEWVEGFDNRLSIATSTAEKIDLKKYSGNLKCVVVECKEINVDGTNSKNEYDFTFTGSTIGRLELVKYIKLGLLFAESSTIGIFALGEVMAKDITVSNCTINRMIVPLKTLDFNRFELVGDKEKSLHVNYLSFLRGTLEQRPDNKIKPQILIEGLSVFCWEFISFHNNSYILVSDVVHGKSVNITIPVSSPEELSEEFTTLMKSRSINVDFKPEKFPLFRIVKSDLGKTNFISCDFADMSLLFIASKITDIFLSGSDMPTRLVGEPHHKQVGYGQIKKVYENRGDSVKSLDFLSRELDSHYEDIKQTNKHAGKWVEKWTLRFNKHTNQFGTDWSKVFPWMFFVSLPLFVFYMASLGVTPEVVTPNGNQIELFFTIISYFLEFLSPIHKADFISEDLGLKANAVSRTIDFFGRIFNGYLIYQFIQAFRKFGKR